jgi:hypothetical protein
MKEPAQPALFYSPVKNGVTDGRAVINIQYHLSEALD